MQSTLNRSLDSRGFKMSNEKCLILNADHSIIKIIKWETGIKLWFSGKVSIVAEYSRYINHPTAKIKVPAVICLKKYFNIYRHAAKVKFSSETLYTRDNHTCAYCGNIFSKGQLTKDHIIPKTHFKYGKATGKETSWLNIITSCKKCNNLKGGRTPKEAGMELKFLPYEPKNLTFSIRKDSAPEEWADYI